MSTDERDDEWLERPDHPLLNSVILTTVFKNLGKRDLKECRLVCKTWNVATIPYIRDAFMVTIYETHEKSSVENFVEVFRSNNLGIPIARFRLGSFCTTDGVGQEFLQLCGDVIKQIEFVNYENMIEDLSEILKSTPNLETLILPENLRSRSGNIIELYPGPEDSKPRLFGLKELHVYFDNREERNIFCPTFLEELFTAAENISSVHLMDSISINDEREEVNDGSSLEILRTIEKLGRESSIQELHLLHEKNDDSEYIEILRKMSVKPDGLKLKTFHYKPIASDQETHRLFELVSLFKHTLEDLKLEGNHSVRLTEFLKMSHLTRLSIELFRSYNFNSECVNLNKIFPALKELQLFYNNSDPFDRSEYEFRGFFPDSEPCPNLNSFDSTIIFHMNEFNQMLNVFRNLTKLSLRVGEDGAEVLRQIWSQMAQLNHLSIDGTLQSMDSMDSILTGISPNTLHEIKDAVDNLDNIPTKLERRDMIMRLKRQHSQLPSIGNLTHLRSLCLSLIGPSFNRYENGLTNLTGYLCLYSMELLQNLQLYNCQMTKTCCEILTMELGLQSWTFKTLQGDGGINVIPPEQN